LKGKETDSSRWDVAVWNELIFSF